MDEPKKEEHLGMKVLREECLDYLKPGEVSEKLSKFKSQNPEWVDHDSPNALYPKG